MSCLCVTCDDVSHHMHVCVQKYATDRGADFAGGIAPSLDVNDPAVYAAVCEYVVTCVRTQ